MNDTLYDNIIVGAGISGLGLGHLCVRAGLRTLALEQTSAVGGCLHSQSFDQAGGYWLEMGAHTCYNSYGNLLQAVEDVGLVPALKLKEKVSFKVLEQDAITSIMSRLHPLEMALSLPRLLSEKKTGKSVREFYSRVLGQRNYAELFGPAFNAVICQSADDFPADMLFRRKPRRKDRPRSFTLPKGLSTITQALSQQASFEVQTNQAVSAIGREQDQFIVTAKNGETWRSRHLTLATPPDQAATLLSDEFAPLADLLKEILMSRIETVSVVIERQHLELDPLAGIIAPDDAFYAAVSRDYFPDDRYRGFSFHFRPGQLNELQQLARIADVLGVSAEQFVCSARKENRLPALRVGHAERVRKIDRLLTDDKLMLTGNYFIGVSIEDCLTRSAGEFKRVFDAD